MGFILPQSGDSTHHIFRVIAGAPCWAGRITFKQYDQVVQQLLSLPKLLKADGEDTESEPSGNLPRAFRFRFRHK
jgi:hypothetical protein